MDIRIKPLAKYSLYPKDSRFIYDCEDPSGENPDLLFDTDEVHYRWLLRQTAKSCILSKRN